MDYKEVIELLQIDYDMFPDDGEHYSKAIEALEKQIPKKGIPYSSAKSHNYLECSVCNTELHLYYKYCTNCGQRLNWRD